MLPLRYARRWQLAGVAILGVVLLFAWAPEMWFLPDFGAAGDFLSDKWLHGLTFAGLTLWFTGQYERRSYWRLVIWLLAFGLLIEVFQQFLPYRSAEMMDFIADLVGIGAGLLIAVLGTGGWSLRFERWLQAR